MAEAEFLAAYGKELRALVRNEKAVINKLTFLAEDAKTQGFAPGIVSLLENHLMTCPAPQKLPAMYLLDSIVKNVQDPYKALFAKRLPQVFGSVWGSALQDTRTKLQKLLNLWKGHFPESVLQAAGAHITAAASSAPTAAPGLTAVRPVSAQQPLQGYSLAGQPALVAAQPGFQAFAGFPMAVASTGNGTYATFGQPLQLPVGAGAAPMGAQLVLGGMPMMAGQPVLLQQRIMVAGPPASAAMVVAPAAGGAPPSPTPVPQWMQQPAPAFAIQQQQQQQPPPPPARSKRSPSPSMLGSAAGGQQQGPGALAQMLGNLAAGGLLSQPGLPAEDPALRITTFDPAFIKEYHPGVVQQLQALSKGVATALKDLEFHRKRRKAAGGAVSRQWYVTSQDWIAGTVVSTAAPADAFGGEEEQAAAPAQVFLEPEDPTQPTCAISGEPFDKVYDDKQDDWFYQDAKRIYGADAERYGVPDGSIVKVKCLAEASGLPAAGGGAADADAEDAARLAADMAAAAAEAPDALEAPAAAGSAGPGAAATEAAAAGPSASTPPGLDAGAPVAAVAVAAAAAVVKSEPETVDALAGQQAAAAAATASSAPAKEEGAGGGAAASPVTTTPAAAVQEALQPPQGAGAGVAPQPLVVPQPAQGPGEGGPMSTGSKRTSETFSEEVGTASKRLKAAGI